MAVAMVDIVVPIYNGAMFIKPLIDTLKKQTFKDFKVIFVDDGSTDNSLQVLEEELKNATFENTVVHQENGGLPCARNTGIKNSNSPWITFVDCDDLLDSHYVEYLYKSVADNNTNLGYCGFQPVPYGENEKIKDIGQFDCKVVSAKECMEEYYKNWFGAWCVIINREYLLENDLFFDEECTYCEDIPFITQAIEATENVSKVNNDVYIYLLRQGSLIRNPKIEKYKVGIAGFLRVAKKIESKNSEAAKVFLKVGKVRYMIATLRKGAVQLPLKKFKVLTEFIDKETIKSHAKNLPLKLKISGYIYLVSKTLFYYVIRSLFKD